MIRVIVRAPQWAIEQGLARAGDVDTQLFDTNDKTNYEVQEAARSGVNARIEHVHASTDDELYVLGY